jgi:hypothetical protein
MKKLMTLAAGMLFVSILQGQTLIHYWHFNNMPSGAVDSVLADFSLLSPVPAITYPGTGSGYLDQNSGDGSAANARMGEPAGASLRARNPSDTRDLFIPLPTTGFEDVILQYEVYRSNNGQLFQMVYYTLDGNTFTLADTISVGTSYATFTFDFTSISGADNNPNFAVKIEFDGQHTGASGNNRFDNFTLEGTALAPIQTREVTFEITDGANPLVGASVTFSGVTLTTNVIGRTLFVVPEGPNTYSVAMPGFASIINEPVVISSDTSISVTLSAPIGQVLHYWHFNDIANMVVNGQVDSLQADYSISGLGQALVYYGGSSSGYMDDFNPGSPLNTRFGEPAGDALRVRNRSDSRALIFQLPTTNCEDLVFSFDLHRSGSGMLENIIEYTLDGSIYTNAGLQNNEIAVPTSYDTFSFDFTNIQGANNNPNFGIRITYRGNTEIENGNNRYDNIVLAGKSTGGISTRDLTSLIQPIVFPNPANQSLAIVVAGEGILTYTISEISGRIAKSGTLKTAQGNPIWIEMADIPSGIYFLQIHIADTTSTHKIHVVH